VTGPDRVLRQDKAVPASARTEVDESPAAAPPAVTRAPVTLTQRSSLLMSAHNPSREFMSWVYQLNGRLNVEALARAIDDVVEAHDMLRVRFEDRGDGPEQFVTPFRPGVLQMIHLDDRPKLEGLTAAVTAIEADYQDLSPWDDSRLQATLYLLTPKTNVLAVFVAEALVDGDSGTLVASEISRAYAKYAGQPAPDLPVPNDESFLRYVLEHPLKPGAEERAEKHWRPLIGWPAVAGQWPMTTGDRNVVRQFKVTRPEWERMLAGTPALVSTPYVVLLSWLEMALCRVAGAEQFLVTSAVSNRRLPVTRGMIGNFVGPVRMEAEVHPGEGLEDVSPRVLASLRATIAASIMPIPLAEQRVRAPAPYVPTPPQVSFFLFDERQGLDLAGVRQRRFRVHTGARDVLRVNCTPDEEGGRNFFFISASATPELLDELVAAYRSLLDGGAAGAAGAPGN
jgi:hypothetical protein